MEERLQKNIEAFNSLVLCEVPLTEDLFQAPLHYVLGDFDIASLPHFRTLNAVIAAINPHGEVSIGIGFETYCRRIRAGIEACRNKESETISFMLPLWDEHNTHNFMMKVSHMGDKLGILFFYYDESGNSSGMDNMLASNFKDSLTGLFNRRTMKQHIIENHRDGYLCLFDLNKFKVINDTFGHGVGDDVLILVAKFLISIASDKEVFYRRSGDEFMILFFGLDRDYAKGVLDRVEDYLEHLHENELKAYPTLRCGASFGVLELRYPEGEEPIDGDTEMKLTDLAMYQAKRAGKRYHFISHEDAVDIIKQGNLDERLNQLAASISR